MIGEPIPPEVREFLLERIDSVAQLEALVLLRDSPQQDWTVPDLARRLYVNVEDAAQILSGLVAWEIAKTDGTVFRYHARDAQYQSLIDRVVQTYALYLIAVTKLIHDNTLSIRKFADAFKIRKDR